MSLYYVYVIQSHLNNKYYIGYTYNLNHRVKQHNEGKSKYTNKYRPYKLIYYETFIYKTEAIKREIEIKKMKGGNTFKTLIKKD